MPNARDLWFVLRYFSIFYISFLAHLPRVRLEAPSLSHLKALSKNLDHPSERIPQRCMGTCNKSTCSERVCTDPQYKHTCSYQLQQATCSGHQQQNQPLTAFHNLQRPLAAFFTTCNGHLQQCARVLRDSPLISKFYLFQFLSQTGVDRMCPPNFLSRMKYFSSNLTMDLISNILFY